MRNAIKALILLLLVLLSLPGSAPAAQSSFMLGADGYWYAPPLVTGSIEDFSINWSARLAGDTIMSSSWSHDTGITLGVSSVDATGTITSAWISGGITGTIYIITNTIITSGGRTFVCPFKVEVVSH